MTQMCVSHVNIGKWAEALPTVKVTLLLVNICVGMAASGCFIFTALIIKVLLWIAQEHNIVLPVLHVQGKSRREK